MSPMVFDVAPSVAVGWVAGLSGMAIALQLPAVAILLSRLLQGPSRLKPLQPQRTQGNQMGQVSVVVPTLNEAHRIQPCLDGLSSQSYEVREVIVVDSHSTDGTGDVVKRMQQRDPRFRLIFDDPLPPNWVGRPWALHTGFLHSSNQSTWILGIDADTQPQPGLVASLIRAAEERGYDLVSLSPRFILKDLGEIWLQPALLMTLVYRFGPSGAGEGSAERVMANGQCFLCRRSLLVQLDGYTSARQSFCDDVTLARYAASQGAKVAFWDGANLLKVRMYEGMAETWREWGRSLDLKDACSPGQIWGDLWFLTAVQGMPLLITVIWSWLMAMGYGCLTAWIVWGMNASLVMMRVALLGAIAPSYDFSQAKAAWSYWLSPLADPLAVWRIFLSSTRTPTQWRGRQYTIHSERDASLNEQPFAQNS
jgi:dolichol-phosphate mannosyltransferase